MTGIKRRLGSLLGPRGYNATGAAEDQQTIASYMAARIGDNPVSEALDEAIDAQTTPVRSRANEAHALAQNVSGRVDAFEVLTETTPGNVDDATIGLHVAQPSSYAHRSVMGVFAEVSTNLFDIMETTRGMLIAGGQGEPTARAEYSVSDPIPVNSGAMYSYDKIDRVTYFDASGNYLHNDDPERGPASYPARVGARYVRLSILTDNLEAAQMNIGDVVLPYEPGRPAKIREEHLPEVGEIQPASITPEKTTFFEAPSNLFIEDNVTPGVFLTAGSGTPEARDTYNLSDPIPVTGGATYSYAYVVRVTYFDEAGDYIQDHSLPAEYVGTYTAPIMTTHVRLSLHSNYMNEAQMNAGDELLPYEAGGPAKIREEHLPPITPVETSFFEPSSNLFHEDQTTPGYILVAGTAIPSERSSYNLSDPIPVTGGETYTYAYVVRVTYLNIAGDYVAHDDLPESYVGTYTAPVAATHVRLSLHVNYMGEAQMNIGDTVLPYEPGFPKIPARYISAVPPASKRPTYLVDTNGLDAVYTAPTIEAQPDLDATTTADVHAWYDDLVTAHPDYVSGTDIGLSSDGVNQLRAYTFKPAPVPTEPDGSTIPELETPVPVALIFSGVHGFEKAAVYHTWRFAKALCEEWDTSPVLDAIRWNVEVIIVPVGNPYGYDISQPGIVQRPNANGVDVARNFPTDWAPGVPGSTQYGGTAPLTEPENIALNNLMASVADRAVMGASMHCFTSSSDVSNVVIWQAAASDLTLDLGKQLISRMSRKWNQEQPWITDTRTYYGYSDDGAPIGSEGRQFESYGIPGATFETSRNQLLDGGPGDRHTSEAMTLGYEATVNYIALGLHTGINLKNRT